MLLQRVVVVADTNDWLECVSCWARAYWGCTRKHRSQLSQHDVLTFVQQDWNMTITTVLHSPYTPGRPRAARTSPACELRPGPSRSRGLFYCPGRTVRTRPGSRGPGLLAVMSCSRKTRALCRSRYPEQSSSRSLAVTGLPAWPVRANIPDNNVMVSSLSLSLDISQ